MASNFAKIALGQNFKPQPTANISNPTNGDMYYDSTRNTFVQYNNGVWQDAMSRSDVASAATLTSTNFSATVVQSSLVRITGSTAGNITGLTASADGKYLVLYNESSVSQILKNQDVAESTAANRVICPSNTDLTLTAGQSAFLTYDGSQARWVVLLAIPATVPSAPQFNVTSQTSAYAANINDYVIASGSSFIITLPNAGTSGYEGQSIYIEHNGTSLTQVYTLDTTAGQTIGGVATGSYALYTNGEVLRVISDGSNWQIAEHKAVTGWNTISTIGITSTSANVFTIAPAQSITDNTVYTNNSNTYIVSATTSTSTTLNCSGNGTPSATGATNFTIPSSSIVGGTVYEGAYTFTITAGNSASVGAVYSNNGNNYTVAITFNTSATSIVLTGAAAPTASGTLTYVSGTHTGGNITFSAFSGDATTKTYTAIYTSASSTALYASNGSGAPSSSTGTIVMVSGTGPATLAYSAESQGGILTFVSGSPTNNLFFSSATTNIPVKGSTTEDKYLWRRLGDSVEIWYNFVATSAGSAGSGDYIFDFSQFGSINTNTVPYSATPLGNSLDTVSWTEWRWPAFGLCDVSTNFGQICDIVFYSPSSFKIEMSGSETGFVSSTVNQLSTSGGPGYTLRFTVPISGWQP